MSKEASPLTETCQGMIDLLHDGIFCTCGERIWPDCDISRVSTNQAYREHLEEMSERNDPHDPH